MDFNFQFLEPIYYILLAKPIKLLQFFLKLNDSITDFKASSN